MNEILQAIILVGACIIAFQLGRLYQEIRIPMRGIKNK